MILEGDGEMITPADPSLDSETLPTPTPRLEATSQPIDEVSEPAASASDDPTAAASPPAPVGPQDVESQTPPEIALGATDTPRQPAPPAAHKPAPVLKQTKRWGSFIQVAPSQKPNNSRGAIEQVNGTKSHGTFEQAYETFLNDPSAEPVVEAVYIYSADGEAAMVPRSQWKAELVDTGRTIVISDRVDRNGCGRQSVRSAEQFSADHT